MNTLYEIVEHFDIPLVEQSGVVDDLEAFITLADAEEGNEGYILRFESGHMLKVKNSWYVRIHKVKDKIRTDRHILALLLENELDDVYPHLDENDYNRVKAYEADFHFALSRKVREIEFAARDAWLAANFNKKALATEVLPRSNLDKVDWQIVFKYADGDDNFVDLVMKRVHSKLGNTAKYNELAAWLGLTADQGENE
jgi:RNA ligase